MTASPKKSYISQLYNSHNVSGRTFAPWNYGLFASKTIRSREQKLKGAKVPESESSNSGTFASGANGLGSERSSYLYSQLG